MKNPTNTSDLDLKMQRIQKSTRTSVKSLIPLHDRMRMRYSWYYRWHLKPSANKIHWITAITYALLAIILIIFLVIIPIFFL